MPRYSPEEAPNSQLNITYQLLMTMVITIQLGVDLVDHIHVHSPYLEMIAIITYRD